MGWQSWEAAGVSRWLPWVLVGLALIAIGLVFWWLAFTIYVGLVLVGVGIFRVISGRRTNIPSPE